jgi:CubicO group peptidase (beta-lactamase class C family)
MKTVLIAAAFPSQISDRTKTFRVPAFVKPLLPFPIRLLRFAAATLLTLQVWLPVSAVGQQLPRATQLEAVGISAERIARIRELLESHVAEGTVAGAVAILVRDGQIVAFDSAGLADVETGTPMRTNTIFRIASMSKAITSVAIMMLQEDGRLMISDPVSRYLPEFTSMRVLVPDTTKPESWVLVPARRSITIRDLLTHQSGLAYGFNNAGPVGNGYREADISDGIAPPSFTLEENVKRLAAQPLLHHPGEADTYGLNMDVLGRLVEIVSGQPFESYLRQSIFEPLGMLDTGFHVPDRSVFRIATPYTLVESGLRAMNDPDRFGNTVMAGRGSRGSSYASGGAGLYSTAVDYVRFLQMLLNGGELDGARILSPKSIELMTLSHSSHLTSNLGGNGQSFGLGFAILEDVGVSGVMGSPRLYRWNGIYGTVFWVDPVEKLAAVLMIQRYPTTGLRLSAEFRVAVYQAITKSYSVPR